ncbi:ATP-binding cassette domain-containing protein [Aureimonas pseudogalii]|uniref:Glycine betaine/proline transport system ATP-binding protein n=1 Tax=Aureimonas pseudogalii TaxID=1744844 RepID=A0A7W6H4C3_9HYPH|nr:ATP-binding cassette domain-containing protein [Aureimonas pseudogalii]MBB3998147.1 glycine betaine/proline transport system ATP-binding protein [Aureimonas pseudogalii]
MTPQIHVRRLAATHGRRPGAALDRADRGEDLHAVRLATETAVALIDVDLDIHPGEILVVLGAPGSGKSSLLAVLHGDLAPERGSVAAETASGPVELRSATKRQRDRWAQEAAALVAGPVALTPKSTIAETVIAALARHGTPRSDRAPRATLELANAGLRDWGEIRIADLPPGLRPRVQLLVAALGGQPILLLDDPFDGVDAWRDPSMVGALRRLRERTGKSVVLTSRDPAEALRVGDRIAVLDNGRLVQAGTPRDLLLEPATPHVAAYLSELSPVSFLQAEDVMGPIAPDDVASSFAGLVQVGTPLTRVLPALARGDVVVADRGRLLGRIGTRELQAVLSPRG